MASRTLGRHGKRRLWERSTARLSHSHSPSAIRRHAFRSFFLGARQYLGAQRSAPPQNWHASPVGFTFRQGMHKRVYLGIG